MMIFLGQMMAIMWLSIFGSILMYFLAFKWLSKWSKTTEIGQKTKEVSKGLGQELGETGVGVAAETPLKGGEMELFFMLCAVVIDVVFGAAVIVEAVQEESEG